VVRLLLAHVEAAVRRRHGRSSHGHHNHNSSSSSSSSGKGPHARARDRDAALREVLMARDSQGQTPLALAKAAGFHQASARTNTPRW
jgi:hypothetical protein